MIFNDLGNSLHIFIFSENANVIRTVWRKK